MTLSVASSSSNTTLCALQFVSADPGDSPFVREIYESVDTVAGTIDYGVGVADGSPGHECGYDHGLC